MQIRKNILSRVTCASSLPPSAVCRIQSGGVTCFVFDSCGSGHSCWLKRTLETKCGSKFAEISHPSARISTPEDGRVSSSSSTKSSSQYLASKAEERRGYKLNSQTTKPRFEKERERSRTPPPGGGGVLRTQNPVQFSKFFRSYRSHGTRPEPVQFHRHGT